MFLCLLYLIPLPVCAACLPCSACYTSFPYLSVPLVPFPGCTRALLVFLSTCTAALVLQYRDRFPHPPSAIILHVSVLYHLFPLFEEGKEMIKLYHLSICITNPPHTSINPPKLDF